MVSKDAPVLQRCNRVLDANAPAAMSSLYLVPHDAIAAKDGRDELAGSIGHAARVTRSSTSCRLAKSSTTSGAPRTALRRHR